MTQPRNDSSKNGDRSWAGNTVAVANGPAVSGDQTAGRDIVYGK